MNSECALRQVSSQPTLSIRGRTTRAQLPATIGAFLGEVCPFVAQHGKPAGPPFARYHSVVEEEMDLEVGLPVITPLSGQGRIAAGELPGGEVALLSYFGPYEGLYAACHYLVDQVAAQGRQASGPLWEVYVTDPGTEPDPSKWQTDIYLPLLPRASF
jgi:effector-binding domain-containing protein